MMNVKMKVKSFVEWQDPFQEKVKHCRFYVEIKNLPQGLPIDPVNTRPQNIKQKLYQGVVRTATHTPEVFHHNSNGLYVVVREFKKLSNGEVELSFGPKDGVGDGAHSYLSCLEANNRTGGCDGFISFNVVSKLDEKTLKKSCLSRNSSISNKIFTRHNYEGKFDLIKAAVAKASYADLVGYRENENQKRIPVRNLIAMASLFVAGEKQKEPSILAYLNKTYTLEKFVESTLLEDKNPFNRLTKILPDVYELSDFITVCLSDYQAGLGFQKDTYPSFFRMSKTRSGHKLYFRNLTCLYLANDAVVYPILASLRSLVKEDKNGNFTWKKSIPEIQKMIQKKIARYYKVTLDFYSRTDENVITLGKNVNYWKELEAVTNSVK